MAEKRKITQTVDPGGMSVAEIAAIEGCPEDEVRQLIKAALQKLRSRAIAGRRPEINHARNYFRDRNL